MEILDVDGLPPERVEYLKNLIQLWRQQGKNGNKIAETDHRFTSPINFGTHNLGVKEEITRASAYED